MFPIPERLDNPGNEVDSPDSGFGADEAAHLVADEVAHDYM